MLTPPLETERTEVTFSFSRVLVTGLSFPVGFQVNWAFKFLTHQGSVFKWIFLGFQVPEGPSFMNLLSVEEERVA